MSSKKNPTCRTADLPHSEHFDLGMNAADTGDNNWSVGFSLIWMSDIGHKYQYNLLLPLSVFIIASRFLFDLLW